MTAQATTPGAPTLEAGSLEQASAFVAAAGLILEEVSGSHVSGHINLGPDHHTPWGIVHGGVYTTAIEGAASIGASTAVKDHGMVAVGLTNTTHFLRSVTSGRVHVEARPARPTGRTEIRVAGLHVGYMDTDMAASVTSPKSDPADIAKIAVDGLEGDLYEIVADDISHQVQSGLAGGVPALYP